MPIDNIYQLLAAEYYDSALHPTCANFRYASAALIEPLVAKFGDVRRICEIGCGRSVAAEMLDLRGCSLSGLCLTDAASSMLWHSDPWKSKGAQLLVAEASDLPFADSTVPLCIACLGDPYNDKALWSELGRILSPHGHVIFTTPSYEWASSFRKPDCCDLGGAEFQLANGRTVVTPSIITDEETQNALIRSASLDVIDVTTFRYSQLPVDSISAKLRVAAEADLPVVTAYLAEKS